MWPLSTEQVRLAIAEVASPLSSAIEEGQLTRAISWIGPELKRGDIFFVVEWASHSIAPDALSKGVVCVVSKKWGGIVDLNPAQRSRCFVSDDPLKAHRALAAFMRKRFTFPVVAVGGSNGKTTTKDMIALVLGTNNTTSTSGTNNGWTGTPITLCHPHHHQARPAPSACVIEIGIDEKGAMLEHVKIADPDIAVLTALGPEHLAGLGSHEEAIKEELVLFDAAKKRVWLGDEPALWRRLDQFREGSDLLVIEKKKKQTATSERPTLAYERNGSSLSVYWEGERHDVALPVPGNHNARNAALAIAVGILLGRPAGEFARALSSFRGPEQRCVITNPTPDLTLIDDTYNASPSSVEAALAVLSDLGDKGERIVVLGDMLDLGAESDHWHASIAPLIASLTNTHVRLYGDHMPKIAPLLGDSPLSIGIAKKEDDPTTLLDDLALNDQPRVVLVKGSRGMTLERVVAKVLSTQPAAKRVGVLVDEDLARELRARKENLFVQVVSLEDLERGLAQRTPFDVAVISDSLPFRATGDPEADLAAMAQLLVTLEPHGKAIFMGDSEDHAEARELLIQVVPAWCQVVRSAHSPHLG